MSAKVAKVTRATATAREVRRELMTISRFFARGVEHAAGAFRHSLYTAPPSPNNLTEVVYASAPGALGSFAARRSHVSRHCRGVHAAPGGRATGRTPHHGPRG